MVVVVVMMASAWGHGFGMDPGACARPGGLGVESPVTWDWGTYMPGDRCDCDPGGRPFGGGAGSIDDPYKLCAAYHLDAVRHAPAAHHMLCADIDLGGIDFPPIPEIAGELDGNGYAVCNWRLVDPSLDDGAFVLELTGHLHDLLFLDFEVDIERSAAGLVDTLVAGSGALMEDLLVTGFLRAYDGHAGGVVQEVQEGTTLRRVLWNGHVEKLGGGYIGAVVDTCRGYCGRLVATGTLYNNDWKSGGVAHAVVETGELVECISRVKMDGQNRSGGLVAVLSGGIVRDSYFEGKVRETYRLGGAVGETYRSRPTLERVYAAGQIDGDEDIGGLIGFDSMSATVIDSVWDVDATGLGYTDGGGTGLNDADMRDPTHPAFAGWGHPWVHAAGDRPRLHWENR